MQIKSITYVAGEAFHEVIDDIPSWNMKHCSFKYEQEMCGAAYTTWSIKY